MADPLTPCDLWDLTPPTLPPPSRLYCLEPAGLGTPEVESLTGYIVRLAEVHSVRTRILMLHELAPLLGRRRLFQSVNGGLSAFWAKEARALNGTRCWARDGVQALETLTRRHDLRYLTLLPWAEGLAVRGLLRPTRAWCPECYSAWRQAGRVIYEPLRWTLEVVEICPQHRRRLSRHCPYPDCQQGLPLLAPRSRPGYCPRCERWLGSEPATQAPPGEGLAEDELAWQLWVAAMVGECLARPPTFSTALFQQNVADALNLYIERLGQGKAIEVARQMRVSASAVSAWRRKNQVPKLGTLLQLAHLLGTSLVHLLTKGAGAVDFSKVTKSVPPPPTSQVKRPHRPFDTAGIRQALEKALASEAQPPPPMRQVAMQLGYRHSYLWHRFPDLCRAISARHMVYQKERGRQKMQHLCAEVRALATAIHAQGKYPSAYRIEALLSVPGFMRHPAAMTVWHETLRKLGWES